MAKNNPYNGQPIWKADNLYLFFSTSNEWKIVANKDGSTKLDSLTPILLTSGNKDQCPGKATWSGATVECIDSKSYEK